MLREARYSMESRPGLSQTEQDRAEVTTDFLYIVICIGGIDFC